MTDEYEDDYGMYNPETNPSYSLHYWEWWLRDYKRAVGMQTMRGNWGRWHAQELINNWGAGRRRQLSWAEMLETLTEPKEIG